MTSRRNPLLRTAYGISPDRNLRDRQVSILHSYDKSQDKFWIPFPFLSTEKEKKTFLCAFLEFSYYFMTTDAGTCHNWLLLYTRHVSFDKQNSILSLVWCVEIIISISPRKLNTFSFCWHWKYILFSIFQHEWRMKVKPSCSDCLLLL